MDLVLLAIVTTLNHLIFCRANYVGISGLFFFFQDLEFVQVLYLLYVIGMQNVAIVQILIVRRVAVNLAAGGSLVGSKPLLPIMVEEGAVVGCMAGVSMVLDWVLGRSEVNP